MLPDWLKDYIRQELSELKNAPAGIVVLVLIGFGGGWWAAAALYQERFAVMEQRLTALKESSTSEKAAVAKDDIIQGWSGGSLDNCSVNVNGTKLKPFAAEYRAFLMCGLRLIGEDRQTDPAVTISKPFTIEQEFGVVVPISPLMLTKIQSIAAGLPRPSAAPGASLAINVPIWYEIVLLPKGVDPSVIHNVADVERFGGKRFPDDGRGSTVEKKIAS